MLWTFQGVQFALQLIPAKQFYPALEKPLIIMIFSHIWTKMNSNYSRCHHNTVTAEPLIWIFAKSSAIHNPRVTSKQKKLPPLKYSVSGYCAWINLIHNKTINKTASQNTTGKNAFCYRFKDFKTVSDNCCLTFSNYQAKPEESPDNLKYTLREI